MENEFLEIVERIEKELLTPRESENIKRILNGTPNKYLQFHLDNSIRNEHYELAEFILEISNKRGIELKNNFK